MPVGDIRWETLRTGLFEFGVETKRRAVEVLVAAG